MQPTSSQQALSQLQTAESQAQNPNDILQSQNQQLGVQGAQNTVAGLRGAINNTNTLLKQVAPSVMGRTGNSLVTAAQASRQVQNESAPLQANLTDEGNQYNQAQQDLQDLQGKAQTAANGIYQGQQDKLSYLQNVYNSLYQQEQDAATRAFQQQQFAEQQRQFDAQQKASAAALKASASSSLGNTLASLLGGGGSSAGSNASGGNSNDLTAKNLAGNKSKQDAYNAVQQLLGTKNQNLISQTVTAIAKSANNGNTYDKYKIQLLQQLGF